MTWGEGYDAGQKGLFKAVETAELIGAAQERERIIKLLEEAGNSEIIVDLDELIAVIKGENK